MSRSFRVIVGMSFALNILFLGFGAGLLIWRPDPAQLVQRHQRELLAVLPEWKAREVAPILARTFERQETIAAEIWSARNDLLDTLNATNLDEAAFSAQLTQLDQARDQLGAMLTELLTAAARGLNQADRERLAQHIETIPMPPKPKAK